MVCPDLKESSRRLERLLRSQSLLRCWTGTLLLPSDTKLKTVLPRSDFQGLMIISAVEELLQVGHKNCLIGTCLNSLHLQASSNFSEMARPFFNCHSAPILKWTGYNRRAQTIKTSRQAVGSHDRTRSSSPIGGGLNAKPSWPFNLIIMLLMQSSNGLERFVFCQWQGESWQSQDTTL